MLDGSSGKRQPGQKNISEGDSQSQQPTVEKYANNLRASGSSRPDRKVKSDVQDPDSSVFSNPSVESRHEMGTYIGTSRMASDYMHRWDGIRNARQRYKLVCRCLVQG